MKRTLIDRAISEEAKRHAILATVFRSKSQPSGKRNVRPDDGMPAIHVIRLVEKMHRAAEPTRTAGFFAEKFRHASVGARAAGQRVTVIAIRSDDVIIRPWGRHRTDGDCLLSNVKMAGASDLPRLILLTRALFETSDQQHQREHLDLVALVGMLHRNFTRREAM